MNNKAQPDLAQNNQNNQNNIVVGKLGAPFSVRGALKLFLYTESPSDFQNYFNQNKLFIQIPNHKNWQKLSDFSECKINLKRTPALITFSNYPNREQAQLFTHSLLGISREDLPEIPEDEFYWADLENMKVVNKNFEELGVVQFVSNNGASDILHIGKPNMSKSKYLIPFIEPFIVTIHKTQNMITVDWDVDF